MTKQTELGIGQTSYVSFRFKVVDFLPWMYVYEFIMQAKRPDPIQSYETIILPFGYCHVWMLFQYNHINTYGILNPGAFSVTRQVLGVGVRIRLHGRDICGTDSVSVGLGQDLGRAQS